MNVDVAVRAPKLCVTRCEMAYIPAKAKWYIAQLVHEITVESAKQNVVHINYHLVHADSPEDAYEKAQALGAHEQISYANPSGRRVRIQFHGVRQLNVIYEELKDGAEILFEERIGLSEGEIKHLLRSKSQLAVFKPIRRRQGPDYSSNDVMIVVSEMAKRSGKKR
jgi:uncharacterized protein DUF4288